MLSKNLRESAKRQISITANELRQLLFWAAVGYAESRSGSYSDTIESTLIEYAYLCDFENEIQTRLKLGLPHTLPRREG